VAGTITISLAALRANAQALRDLITPTRAAFVVKGNAYGHGMVEVALAIERFAARLCVFSLEEAIELRDGGITAPVMVLGPIAPGDIDAAIDANVEIALWDTGEWARRLAQAAQHAQRRVKAHIKVNTGLNRLGLQPVELPDAVEDYGRLSSIELAGIFSHLAAAEELDSPFTMHQLERFNHAYKHAEASLMARGARPIRHIAASAAAMLWPETRLDMVRYGIALYGLWPSAPTREAMDGRGLVLQPALSFFTELVVLRTIAAGEAVGYGTTFHAPRSMRIGVIPVGYADGVPRALSNTGAVLIDGVRCPIIGRVAMNMTLVDVTQVPNARVEMPVTLIGRNGAAEITADDWAAWCDTINYEIVTRLPAHIPRTFTE
jgi:alanine racemase